jgi:hypothetical protein
MTLYVGLIKKYNQLPQAPADCWLAIEIGNENILVLFVSEGRFLEIITYQ